ncbi:MAG TPA: hypothetical protein PLC90_06060 [Bacteroidales bacterium]|nr:hypothetical protein [Bacteroidales bacterium]
MEKDENNLKSLKKLYWFFVCTGLYEVFFFVYISHNFLGIIPGLITIFPAYISLNKVNKKKNYFVPIWSFIKFCPPVGLIVFFVLQDLFRKNSGSIFSSILIFFYSILGVLSIIFGIILIKKIAINNRIIKASINSNNKDTI